MEAKKAFGELKRFAGRDVELYRSSDPNNTAIYFTELGNSDRKTAKAYLEVLRFGAHDGDHELYIRYPNTDYFVEIMAWYRRGGAHGNMQHYDGFINIWSNQYERCIEFYAHDHNFLLLIGKTMPKFNFMTMVAKYNKGNPYDRPPRETMLNMPELEMALSRKYLELPESARMIAFLFKTDEPTPTYFVVDWAAYYYTKRKTRLRTVCGDTVKEYTIKNHQMWSDGGTIIFTVSDEAGKEHKLFIPQTMFDNAQKLDPKWPDTPKWDDIELKEATEAEKASIAAFFKIELLPDYSNENEELIRPSEPDPDMDEWLKTSKI